MLCVWCGSWCVPRWLVWWCVSTCELPEVSGPGLWALLPQRVSAAESGTAVRRHMLLRTTMLLLRLLPP